MKTNIDESPVIVFLKCAPCVILRSIFSEANPSLTKSTDAKSKSSESKMLVMGNISGRLIVS
jgi:hypothetical protein